MENNFIERNGEEVFKEEFLEFAGYNLQRRAIPDARDGLKWGARQLLFSQARGGFTYDKPFKKASKSVAEAMGFCYVHGDASAYGTFIRMAKPFAYRIPLQEANGNYGTLINPDDHSQARYVELRGSKISGKLLEDINKNTITEWEDTYDLEGQFPKVLPAKGFYNIVNGCISIGSGMSCSIPPTNLKEVNNALITLLNNPNASDEEIICYPDFPTGASILNKEEVKESLLKGNGSACVVRASIEYDSIERCFIVKEMPYSTYTNTICNELATLMEEDESCGIKDFVDYTGQAPDLRIYLTKTANPDKTLQKLYKETSLQNYYTINMVMLDNGITPKLFGWREALNAHLEHERIVYRRGFEYDLAKLNDRIHIISGLLICLANVEEAIQIIKAASSTAEASMALQNRFVLDADQAKAVLDMKLSRLAHLEIKKLQDEHNKLVSEAEHIEQILNNPALLNKEIENGLREVANKYGDERRTRILSLKNDNNNEPIEIKSLQISLTNQNNILTNEVSSLYTQKRGGAGTKIKLNNGEYIIATLTADTSNNILFFTQSGNYYHCAASSLVIGEKTYAGSLMPIREDEHICTFTNLNTKEKGEYIIFITKNGLAKKSSLSEYSITKNIGIKALTLDEGDEITNIIITNTDDIGILTESGNFIIITTDDIRPIGRVARGIKAIKLNDGDQVISAKPIPMDTKYIISISGSGLFKRTPFNEFTIQTKNTKGAKLQKINEQDWAADFYPLTNEQEILIVSTRSVIKLKTEDIPIYSRGAAGTKSIKLNLQDNVMKISCS